MCSNEEIKEMIESYKQLPELYQQSIIGFVRDRMTLYELQIASGQRKTHPNKSYFKTVKSAT